MIYALVYSNEKTLRISRHVLFWLTMFIYNVVPMFDRRMTYLSREKAFTTSLEDIGVFFPFEIVFCYVVLWRGAWPCYPLSQFCQLLLSEIPFLGKQYERSDPCIDKKNVRYAQNGDQVPVRQEPKP